MSQRFWTKIFFLIISFAITDLIIGFHSSFFLLGEVFRSLDYFAKYLKNILSRILGALSGIFFLVTNFGVWFGGMVFTNGLFGLITSWDCRSLGII